MFLESRSSYNLQYTVGRELWPSTRPLPLSPPLPPHSLGFHNRNRATGIHCLWHSQACCLQKKSKCRKSCAIELKPVQSTMENPTLTQNVYAFHTDRDNRKIFNMASAVFSYCKTRVLPQRLVQQSRKLWPNTRYQSVLDLTPSSSNSDVPAVTRSSTEHLEHDSINNLVHVASLIQA